MQHLYRIPVFQKLSVSGRELLERGAETTTVARGKTLLHKGDPVSGAYFVLAGRLRVYAPAPGGTEATLYWIEPGEACVFALNSLFSDLRYPAWVTATESTVVATIPGTIYRQLFAREPAVQDLTVRALSTLVFRLMDELADVHALRLEQRLANLLLVHASAAGVVSMTQQTLADHLGTTREVIGRLMREFADRNWITTRRGHISVLNVNELAKLGHAL